MQNNIPKEAKRIEEDCLYSAKGHFIVSHFWTTFHIWIGVPITILAFTAGIFALSKFDNHAILAGIISIIVTILTAVNLFLNPNQKVAIHRDAGNKYNALRNQVRIFYGIDYNGILKSEQEIVNKLKGLSEERNKLNQENPQIPRWAYKKAKKGIEVGEADYIIDEKEVKK